MDISAAVQKWSKLMKNVRENKLVNYTLAALVEIVYQFYNGKDSKEWAKI